MPEIAANVVTTALALYAAVGVVFAVAFVMVGAARVDHRATGAGWGFRALIFPGSMLFWPLLVPRWLRTRMRPQ